MTATASLVQLGRPDRTPKAMVELTIDGQSVSVAEDTTILGACAALGIDIPTLCYLETLRPANVCRLCSDLIRAWRAKWKEACSPASRKHRGRPDR